jgi:hypothetical protein
MLVKALYVITFIYLTMLQVCILTVLLKVEIGNSNRKDFFLKVKNLLKTQTHKKQNNLAIK